MGRSYSKIKKSHVRQSEPRTDVWLSPCMYNCTVPKFFLFFSSQSVLIIELAN